MMRRRRSLWIVGGAVVALVLGVVGYVVSGSSAIESWVGSQLLEIGASYLGPELRFDRLTYLRPRTIVLENMTLSSPDPAQPGHTVVILSVKRARLELTEIPRRGQPIKFSQVTLESPEIHAIAGTPGGASLVGFSNLLKGSSDARVAGGAAPMKLSDFLLIRHVEIKDGAISYDPRMAERPPIWLDGINAGLDFGPAGNSSEAGIYGIATTIVRKPAFALELQGKVNIDTLVVELAKCELTLDLQEKNAHFLPPEVQGMLRQFEVTGLLRVSVVGKVPLANWRESTLRSTGALTAARVAVGENRLAIDSWNWEVDVAGGVATIRQADARLLGGEMHVTGTIPLDGAVAAHLALRASGLQIEQVLRSSRPDEAPLYAGNVAADITFTAPLGRWNKEAGGGGTFSIREGRIDKLPVLGGIVTGLNNVTGKIIGGNGHALTDQADGSFSFAGDGVRLDHFAGTSGTLAMRGMGTIGFDRRLALRLNAGPMERLQGSLGAVGRVWASASDAMAGYQVGGTCENPQVSMELGGGP